MQTEHTDHFANDDSFLLYHHLVFYAFNYNGFHLGVVGFGLGFADLVGLGLFGFTL